MQVIFPILAMRKSVIFGPRHSSTSVNPSLRSLPLGGRSCEDFREISIAIDRR